MPSVDLRPRKRHPRDKRPAKPMPFDVALRKFKKSCERAGIIQEVRKREYVNTKKLWHVGEKKKNPYN